ncbi:hypothetical protein BJ508DRAFT_358403 [Ascobolus immersus RN42]|uniref:Uncharacterized protein n=1 Tax=Ascobolus immersus RN42 TaxID=1160509 RepID=A0A3N4IJH6_ASCIM|nr:hypothetical protein BJ508DRAFT_358403 [Ascobolus immersus RN42]
MAALRLDARWWLGNVDGVKVVLLVGYDRDGKKVRLEKWTNVTLDRSTRSGIQKAATQEQWMEVSWTQTTSESSPNSFHIDPQSNDPLLLGSAGDILDDITLPPSMDYIISSMDVQELVEDVYQNFSLDN